MFVDQAKILVRSGDGGRGCQSFYRDKYTRHGIPDGGDGGRGAHIIVRADRNLYTLLDFKYNKHFYGKHGAHGSSNKKKGREAVDIIIRVPVGTVISDARTNCVLRDLDIDAEEVMVARGGEGGMGNCHRKGEERLVGGAGEEKELIFDLKLLADVGVIGFPNVGKSSLIAKISNAHPKIAAYPFSTKVPTLGVVRSSHGGSFVIADIPGLIEGSSFGKGLGDKFLRHIERTKLIVHIVDMASFEGRDPIKGYASINKELAAYSKELAKKPQVIAANKMDLPGARENLAIFKKAVKKRVYPISALRGDGLEVLIEAIAAKL